MPVVITGVTRGLGRALAVEMGRRGHRVAGCGRDPAGLESLGREMPGEGHFFMPTDIVSTVLLYSAVQFSAAL